MFDLAGKVAVVTGGAKGIGLACAQKLSAEGARVAIADIDLAEAEKQAAALQNDSLAVHLDVRESDSSRAMASTVLRKLGRVDILVNNAGMNIGSRNTTEVTDEEFDLLMAVNVRGTFTTTRALLPALIECRGGSIINMSSICGQRGVALIAPYSTSKFAIVGMTQSLASELAKLDITVNSVHPGIVATDLHVKVVEQLSERKGVSFQEEWDAFLSLIPLGRYQTPTDVGDMVAFLASSKARNITGSAFNVDGGMML
ncbi:SDR family NAD(P)-dependent oxidoreductase [Mycolicibacterium sp. CBMA 226]|uniref:SDR family NAD(P)-dependent oxidoreductase n=1 Tax=Mycolicibacterium sp. CBMA 226 TaxID=2606611 RepID=UPI0012DCCF0C|nr:SDR family oxidoreductase [Mycolicibacterium sp. CBMA 226]MUL78974.1 SDR family oxidoreductase [Mycolicibacterium sp. CBMA 226]QGW61285.1 putative oxidoreductase [Mycolicibacterium sp.]